MSTGWFLRGRNKKLLLLTAVLCSQIVLVIHYYARYKIYKINPFLVVNSLKGSVNAKNNNYDPEDKQNFQHPYLHKECFVYENFTARFICNDFHRWRRFSSDLISQCASELWKTIRDPDEVDPWSVDLNNASRNADYAAINKRPSVHWVFAGDSHIRNIFEVIVKRLAGPRAKYRISSFTKNKWDATEVMIEEMGHMKHAEYQQVILLDYPLKLTHMWQPRWSGIPRMLDSWIKGKRTPPTHLLFGGVMHFMIHSEDVYFAEGSERAAEKFADQLKELAPLLSEYTKSTPVVYKLQDHVQKCPFNNVTNNDNIELHNKIAKEILSGTGVYLWDSAIPLSDINNEECQLRFKQSEKMGEWRCQDQRHIGYIFIEQYLDMFLNTVCNDVMS